jgi:Asp-tRNA(Asn)/Glu-tRNA(Gln) amidotransferase A subunit family amidase
MAYTKLKIEELKKHMLCGSLSPQEVRKEYQQKAAHLDEKYGLFITLFREGI